MLKIVLRTVLFIGIIFTISVIYLSTIGIKTSQFNGLIKNKLIELDPRLRIELEEVKLILDLSKKEIKASTNNTNLYLDNNLIELSKTNMNVICSGAKSILDLDKTFEILETLRISRLGFKTNYMPGFWYYNTDKKVDHNFSNINELIDYLKIRDHIDQTGSILIFNPVPKNKSIDEKLIQKWIKLSIDKAKINSIKGKELTPFLIKEINKMSENKTLEANIELIINNAALAGKLAKKYYS